MSCIRLISGQNSECSNYSRKYYQQVVLINKDDVEQFILLLPKTNLDDSYECRYRIAFKLKENKSGIRYTASEKANIINGSFSRSLKENIPQYKHNVQIPMFGIGEDTKCMLHQLDLSNYFAVLQSYNNIIEVFGFENGLDLDDFDYNIQNSGGNVMVLTSGSDALEDTMPLVYFSSGNPIDDFDNNFSNIPELPSGDFNDDFNDDFYIE